MSFPRKREGFRNAIHRVWGPNPPAPGLSWTPAFAGVTEGLHIPFILLEALSPQQYLGLELDY